MLTVKWVAENGSESIMNATGDVSYTPPTFKEVLTGRELVVAPCVSFPGDNGVHTTLHTGTIYVMNGNGATIAKYHLPVA